MAEVPHIDTLPSLVADLIRRVGTLERSGGVRNTSMREGTLTITDENDEPMVLVGRFDDGSYGLGVLDGSGNFVSLQRYIFGQQYDEVIISEATASATPTDLATYGPEVVVDVGPTGIVLVTVGAFIGLPAGPTTAGVYVSVDGVNPFSPGAIAGVSNANAAGIAGSFQNSRRIEGLTPGSHTFTLKYANVNGDSTNFSSRTLLVQPI